MRAFGQRSENAVEDVIDHEAIIERAAKWIVSKGLATPAVFLLEMHKPIAPLGSLVMLGAMPFVGPFVGFGKVEQFALMAEDRQNIEKLLLKIEHYAKHGVPDNPPTEAEGQEGTAS